jgi:intracellular septation protein
MKPGRNQGLSLFFAGLLPVIAFTLIEEYYGTLAGLIAGMVFGCGEILWELFKYRKVNAITWIGNGLLLILGGVSLLSSEGFWFKMQPAIMEAMFALFLWGSLLMKKNLLVYLVEQQGQTFPPPIKDRLDGLSLRIGFFFAFHAALASYAAIYWSTTAWALLKGLGLTLSFIVYLVAEAMYLRRHVQRQMPPTVVLPQDPSL